MKNILLTIALATISFSVASAQRTQDVIYLNNGSVIRGRIVEMDMQKYAKIETKDGSLWVFGADEIKNVTKEGFPGRRIDLKEHGYYATLSTGFAAGRGTWRNQYTGFLRFSNGKQFSQHWSLGLGMELNGFDRGLMPLFAESRYNLVKGRTSPYVMGYGGYALPIYNRRVWNSDRWAYRGGMHTGASVGIRHFISSSTAIDVSCGYAFQRTSEEMSWWEWSGQPIENKMIHHYNRIALRIGLLFN